MYIPPADYGHSEPSPEVAYPDGSLPDYTAEPFSAAPSHLIPPPDYGQKQYEPKVDYDSYENVIEYDDPVPRRDTVVPVRTYVEQQIHTVPTPEEPQEVYSDRQAKEHNPIVQTPADVPRHSYVPQLPPKDNFVAHSYLEDKDKIVPSKDKQKSMRSHIRSIGVPVLPPIGGNDHEFFTGKSPAQNKAFIRHMENHRNFDTMKSLKSCENCPICQMMSKEELEAAGNEWVVRCSVVVWSANTAQFSNSARVRR